jgi:two-component system chemotaxis response regulator CheY
MFDPKTRVLIADDMLHIRKMVSAVCKELGFNDLTEVSDGAQAWSQLLSAEEPFGLVISDWMMPNLTGLELLKKVRADQKLASTPFILLTAETEQNRILDAVKAGVSTYIIKPFVPNLLKARIEAVHQATLKKSVAS